MTADHPPTRLPGIDIQFELDAHGRFKRVDEDAHALFGVPTGELIGEHYSMVLAKQQVDDAVRELPAAAAGRLARVACRLRHRDGREFDAEAIACGMDDASVCVIVRAVGELPPAQMDSARLAAIVESSNDAIISKTTAGIVTSWNSAAQRIFGYTADEMIGQSVLTIVPPERIDEERDFLARIAGGEQIQNRETFRLNKAGKAVAVSVTVSPIFGESNEIIGVSSIAREISERQARKAELRESLERFRTLADNISQLAWMADAQGWIFWYNQRWYDYTGTTLDEMQGWGWKKVHHPDHVERVVARIQHSWNTGEPWEDTFPLRGADGRYRWFLSRALPIHDSEGRITRWFGTNTDVTEQREREEQIQLLLREINHRSKNMLALVQAIARQTTSTHPDDFIEHFLERIQALSASQDLLVNSGWRGAYIIDLVTSQLAHFKDLIGSRIRIDGPRLELNAAAAQALGMVVHELATNAGKYGALSNDEGRVVITWQRQDGDGDGDQFSMQWTELDGPPVTAPTRRGFGSVVVEQMASVSLGATAELEYKEQGLVWRLLAPTERAIHGEPKGTALSSQASTGHTTDRKRILIVDDDSMLALDLAERLRTAGFEPLGPAHTVEQALSLLAKHGCDCAVLDINLGDETSEAIAHKLQSLDAPFITLSGYSHTQKPAIFDNVAHLSKPVNTRDLIQAVRGAMSGNDQASE